MKIRTNRRKIKVCSCVCVKKGSHYKTASASLNANETGIRCRIMFNSKYARLDFVRRGSISFITSFACVCCRMRSSRIPWSPEIYAVRFWDDRASIRLHDFVPVSSIFYFFLTYGCVLLVLLLLSEFALNAPIDRSCILAKLMAGVNHAKFTSQYRTIFGLKLEPRRNSQLLTEPLADQQRSIIPISR